jgi:hypothetical protein
LGYECFDPDGLRQRQSSPSLTILNVRPFPVAVCETPKNEYALAICRIERELLREFDRISLTPGRYSVDVSCRTGHTVIAQVMGAGHFTETGRIPNADEPLLGAGRLSWIIVAGSAVARSRMVQQQTKLQMRWRHSDEFLLHSFASKDRDERTTAFESNLFRIGHRALI